MAINRIDWFKSPRLIWIDEATDDLTVQVLLNELREFEDEPTFMGFDKIVDAGGKEELGGGVLVGITATLLDAQVAFIPTLPPQESGTVTTLDANGVVLIDSTALFETNGVQVGSQVINHTDGSTAMVLSIDSEIQLTCTGLDGGTDNQFAVSDDYGTHNIIQKSISGGNLVAVDSIQAELNPVFPTPFNQVNKTSSSSATLQELAAIQYSSFDNAVCIDVDNVSGKAVAGTIKFPAGTRKQPVRDIDTALIISNNNGFEELYVIGNLTISTAVDLERFTLVGESATKTVIDVGASANVLKTEYYECTLTGILDGNSQADRSVISNLTFVDGFVHKCALAAGTITLGTSTIAHMLACYSAVPGTSTPVIDMNSTGVLSLRDYYGGIKLTNYSGASSHSIDLGSGQCILDSATITSGTFVVRGVGKLIDENGNNIFSGTWNGGVTIVNDIQSKEDNLTFVDLLVAKEA